jgi:hypothetical protein
MMHITEVGREAIVPLETDELAGQIYPRNSQ